MPLGLGAGLSKSGIVTPGIVTDNLVLKHKYDAGAVVPVSDGAAYFDGTNDYITMGDISATEGIDTMTLACWAYLTDAAPHPLITKGAYNNSAASFNFKYDLQSGTDSGNGRLNFSVANNIYAFKSSAGYTTNKWHHFAVTYSNTADEIWFYVDGVKITPSSSGSESGVGTAVSIPNTAKEVRIGASDSGSEYAQGYICNAGIWTSVLTQAQIKSIMWKNYAGLTSSEKTNLVSWWNLDSKITSSSNGTENTAPITVYDNHNTTLGSELITNGDFSNGLTGWTTDGVVSVNASGISVFGSTGSDVYIYQDLGSTGNTYKITFDLIVSSGRMKLGTNTDFQYSYSAGTYTNESVYIVPTATNRFIFRRESGTLSATLDNISVKQVNGNIGTLS